MKIDTGYSTLECLIIEDLKESYRLNRDPERMDCSEDIIEPDTELLAALDKVLEYYMNLTEYTLWKHNRETN